jgi:hypothetical protein
MSAPTVIWNHPSSAETTNVTNPMVGHPDASMPRIRDRLGTTVQAGRVGYNYQFDCTVSAIAGTASPSIQFIVETTWDGGRNWYQLLAVPPIANTGTTKKKVGVGYGFDASGLGGPSARVRWVVTGTGPSFTFAASLTAT